MSKIKQVGKDKLPANKQKGTKECVYCEKERQLIDFYINTNPLYSTDGRVPVCKECIKKRTIRNDGSISELKLNEILKDINRPYYKDVLENAYQSFKNKTLDVNDITIPKQGEKILQIYFRLIAMKQDKDKTYEDSEIDNFVHRNIDINNREYLSQKYRDIKSIASPNSQKKSDEYLVYSRKWRGYYTQEDIEYLDDYLQSLIKDFPVKNANHRDYAKKIAKASLIMDKAYENMLNGVQGAETTYKNAKDVFDSLSKSAKFAEEKRAPEKKGFDSICQIVNMVEKHNWIPTHTPLVKDDYDKLLDALSTITKSL